MPTIHLTELKTIPEQVYENTQKIASLEIDVATVQDTANTANTRALEAKQMGIRAEETANQAEEKANQASNEAKDAGDTANQALLNAGSAQATADNATTAVEQAWKKEFIDVIVTPEDFDASLIVTLNNENYALNNIITITASPDDGTTINNNAKNISYCELRPLTQTTDGQIKLIASKMPTVNLYLKIQIEIQIEVI